MEPLINMELSTDFSSADISTATMGRDNQQARGKENRISDLIKQNLETGEKLVKTRTGAQPINAHHKDTHLNDAYKDVVYTDDYQQDSTQARYLYACLTQPNSKDHRSYLFTKTIPRTSADT